MKYRLMLLQWMVLATAMAAPPPAKPPRPEGNRFLFILETSAGMTRLEHGGRQAIFDLIYSGVDGRMRRGDTFGIWTFNGDVHSGIVPMQTYDPRTRLEQAAALGRYLRAHKYDKEGDFDALVKTIHAVVRGAKDVNIFVVTDGNTPFSGTDFDQVINAGFAANGMLVRESKKPVVVALVARQSALVAACVSLAGEKIELAELPPVIGETQAEEAAATNQTASAQQTTKPAGQVVAHNDLEEGSAKRATNTIDMSRAIIMTKPKVTNVIAASPVPPAAAAITPEPAPAATNEAAAVTATAPEPAAATNTTTEAAVSPPTPALVSNDVRASTAPEPLPSFVPAQVKASARAVQPPISIIVPPTGDKRSAVPNLLLILGGAAIGASAVGAIVFFRKVRNTKQPSIISQSFDRY